MEYISAASLDHQDKPFNKDSKDKDLPQGVCHDSGSITASKLTEEESLRQRKEKEEATCPICSNLFTDARELPLCKHNSCYQCICERVKTTDICPSCDRIILPEGTTAKTLTPNERLNNLVGKLVRQGVCPGEYAKEKNTTADYGKTDSVEFDHQVLVRHLSRIHGDKEEEIKVWETHHKRHKNRQCFITCNHCRKSDFIGYRYKCGVCADFDLCDECVNKPREEVHDKSHVLIKIKRQRNRLRDYKPGPILAESARSLGDSYNWDSTTHVGIKCSNCGKHPMEGVRYKCGMCQDYNLCEDCEKKSEEIHDGDHVSMVLPCPIGREPAPGRLVTVDFY